MNWTDERVATLKKLWLDGLSASQIAKQLGGTTRNAVIGKVHRLGLAERGLPSAPRLGARPARKPRPVQVARPRPAVAAAPRARVSSIRCETVSLPGTVASVADLGAGCCKWPIGDVDKDDFAFCGRAAAGIYCVEHARVAYQPRTRMSSANEYARSLRRYF